MRPLNPGANPAQLCCWFLLVLGIMLQLHVNKVGGEAMRLYYPVLLVGFAGIALLNPIRMLHYQTRMAMIRNLVSLKQHAKRCAADALQGRLFCAGFFAVEWSDAYLGDLCCSLTYTFAVSIAKPGWTTGLWCNITQDIALFSCLYAQRWADPESCDPWHSHIGGSLTALPSLWRALQCLRCFLDSGKELPHLRNCGKYAAAILHHITLSVYRVHASGESQILFVAAATLHATYAFHWDTCYDWNLGYRCIDHPLLRPRLAFARTWPYYLAVAANAALRMGWTLYIAFPHSSQVSFGVSLAEVLRRGIWSVMRLEAAHCGEQDRNPTTGGLAPHRVVLSMPDMTTDTLAHGTNRKDLREGKDSCPCRSNANNSHRSGVRSSVLTKPDSVFLTKGTIKKLQGHGSLYSSEPRL
jgi:xenotropic and polytropic retrovirus receptor 1